MAWENAAPMESGLFLNHVQPASNLCKNHVLDLEFAGTELDIDLWCSIHGLQMHF